MFYRPWKVPKHKKNTFLKFVGGLAQVNYTTFLQLVPIAQGGTKTAF